MNLSIKTKIASGIAVMFGLLMVTCIVALVALNLVSAKMENLLTANYKTIRYCNQMMHALNALPQSPQAYREFEAALSAQEKNITEPGEFSATAKVRAYFSQLQSGNRPQAVLDSINDTLYYISIINQRALEHKNRQALGTAASAKLWLTILTTLVMLVCFSLAFNLPGVVAAPLGQITEGIREIGRMNYKARINLSNKDEFGEMATAFNKMAERLDEWESSSMARIMFEKSRIDSIINQMEDAVFGLDAEGRILFINSAAAALFFINPSEVTGKLANDVAQHNDLLRAILSNDLVYPLKIVVDNKEQFFNLNQKAVVSDGKSLGDVYTLKNITQYKELDLSKTNLLATISHELKTPISSIKMSANLLADARIGAVNAEQHEMVANIIDDADRLLRLTAELLNLTQIETGNIQLRFQHIQPKLIVDEAVAAVNMQAHQKSIQIVQHMPDLLPLILADADKTALVLVNLLSNAIKYSPNNSTVSVSLKQEGSKVSFVVQDEGEGIDDIYLSRIFDRYFKVPGSINKTGTGLGLAISKEFIEAQNGKITVKSQIGKGSSFQFSLPLA
jgi:signal transduction histidine kinase